MDEDGVTAEAGPAGAASEDEERFVQHPYSMGRDMSRFVVPVIAVGMIVLLVLAILFVVALFSFGFSDR